MTKRKEAPRTSEELIRQAKAMVVDERADSEMRQKIVQVAYEVGLTEGRLQGATSALDQIKAQTS
jgi:hypothetical protein